MKFMFAFVICLVVSGSSDICAQTLSGAPAPDLLAQGPLPIIFHRTLPDGVTPVVEKGNLFQLRQGKLVFILAGKEQPVVYEPRKNYRAWVEAESIKQSWHVDPATGKFTGKVIPVEPIDMKSIANTPQFENRYLYYYLEEIQQRLDSAVGLENAAAVKTLKMSASELATHIRKKNLNSDLREQYESFKTYAEIQEGLFARRRALFEEAYKKADALKREEANAESRRQAGSILGLFGAFVSAIPRTEYYTTNTYTGVVTEYQSVDNAGIASGLGTMVEAQRNFAQESARLKAAQTTLKNDVAAEYEAMQKEFQSNRRGRVQTLRSIGERHFQIARTEAQQQDEELADQVRKMKDYTILLDLMMKRAKHMRGNSEHDSPYLLVEAYCLKCSIPEVDAKKRIAETYALAQDCVATAKLIPAGAIYNPHRREVLKTAAGLAVQSAALEIGNNSNANSYSFKSLYAMQLLDTAAEYTIPDVGGDLRSMRSLALLQVGRKDDALQQAVEVEALFKESPSFMYNLARLYSVNGNTKEAMRCLTQAMKVGYSDIKALQKDADMIPLRANKDYANFVKMKLDSKVIFPARGFGAPQTTENDVEIINRSAYTLTNVKLQLVVTRGRTVSTYNVVVDRPIGPNETYTWKNAFNTPLSRDLRGSVKLESDQGSIVVLPK